MVGSGGRTIWEEGVNRREEWVREGSGEESQDNETQSHENATVETHCFVC